MKWKLGVPRDSLEILLYCISLLWLNITYNIDGIVTFGFFIINCLFHIWFMFIFRNNHVNSTVGTFNLFQLKHSRTSTQKTLLIYNTKSFSFCNYLSRIRQNLQLLSVVMYGFLFAEIVNSQFVELTSGLSATQC